jgi:hypothetical protein
MGPSRFTSHPRGRCAEDFYALKNPSPWPGFEPATFGSSDQHTNYYTTKETDKELKGENVIWMKERPFYVK